MKSIAARAIQASASALFLAFFGVSALAQAPSASGYPTKPIRLVVPFTPGGSTDVLARAIGQELTMAWGQSVVVENVPGAGGAIGADKVAKAAPDGYTLMVSPASFLTTNKSIWKALPYNPETDFTPITKLVNQPMVLVVRDKSRFATPADVLAAAKANPGKLTYASSGDGSPQHLAGLMFTNRTGVEMLHVPYKGGAPAITDLMGGVVDMAFSPLPEALPHIKAGKLHPVGILSDKRASTAPDIPTLKEGGVNNVVLSAWIGLLAPAKTPQPVIDKLNQSVKTMLHSPDMKAKLQEAGMESAVDEAKPLQQVISEEIKIHAELVKAAGLVPQ